MKEADNDEIKIDLKELFFVVKSKIWVLLLVGIIAAVGTGMFTRFTKEPKYQSTCKLYILNKSSSITSLSLSDLQLGTQLTKDYMILVKSRPVMEEVIRNLSLDLSYEGLTSILSTNNPTDTRILEITAEYPDAYIAKQIVDEVATVSAKRIADIMDMQEPSVIEEGYISNYPISPNVGKNSMMAGLLSVALAIGVICVSYLMNDSIKSTEDITTYIGIPTLGTIPLQQKVLHRNENDKDNKKNKKNKIGIKLEPQNA